MLTAYKIKDSALADKAEPIIVLKIKLKKVRSAMSVKN